MRRRRRIYKFTEKSHSKRAIAASVAASLLLVLYLVFVYLAYKSVGGLSAYYGSAGVMAMLLSIISLVVSITSFKEEDSFQLFPRLAFITSLGATILWTGTFIIGLV